MKRYPVLLLLLLSCVGCESHTPLAERYGAERALFLAERDFSSLRIRPELNNAADLARIRGSFRDIVARCQRARDHLRDNQTSPENPDLQQLHDIAYRASIRLSQFAFTDRQYDSAAQILAPFISDIPIALPDRIVAAYNVGRAAQSAGKWDYSAATFRTMFSLLDQAYDPVDSALHVGAPLFDEALAVPVTFARMAKQFGIADPFTFDSSQAFYQHLIERRPTSNIADRARANLASLNETAENWPGAIAALTRITDSTGRTSLAARLRIADIEATELHQTDSALAGYAALEQMVTGDDTLMIPELRYRRAATLLTEKKYDAAAQMLVELERNYPGYYNVSPAPQQAKARIFELTGDRDRAESEYQFLIEKYPNSGEAMATFLHLAAEAAARHDTADVRRWYDRAAEHYDQAAARGAGTALEALAMNFRAELYRQQEDWPRAAAALEEIYHRFPAEQLGREALVKAASIYAMKLGDSTRADSLVGALRRAMSPVDAGM